MDKTTLTVALSDETYTVHLYADTLECTVQDRKGHECAYGAVEKEGRPWVEWAYCDLEEDEDVRKLEKAIIQAYKEMD